MLPRKESLILKLCDESSQMGGTDPSGARVVNLPINRTIPRNKETRRSAGSGREPTTALDCGGLSLWGVPLRLGGSIAAAIDQSSPTDWLS